MKKSYDDCWYRLFNPPLIRVDYDEDEDEDDKNEDDEAFFVVPKTFFDFLKFFTSIVFLGFCDVTF